MVENRYVLLLTTSQDIPGTECKQVQPAFTLCMCTRSVAMARGHCGTSSGPAISRVGRVLTGTRMS